MNEEGGAPAGTLAARINDIEEAYEFMLAYAAQAHPRGAEGDHVRDFLRQADAALDGLGDAARAAVKAAGADMATFAPYLVVLDDDAARARAGIRLAFDQRAIGSQLIDNLNASIHLRALITDLFLVDEAIASTGA